LPASVRDPARFSRRRFIQTAGVTITLPMLPSLLHTPNASAQQTCTPIKRFIAYMFPNGHKMDEHKPAGSGGAGSAWTLPAMLAPYQDLKQDLLFVGGLENQQRRRETGDHAIGCGALLTARKPTSTRGHNSSIDRVIADAIGAAAASSLQLGIQPGPSDTFGTDYTRSISWKARRSRTRRHGLVPARHRDAARQEIDAKSVRPPVRGRPGQSTPGHQRPCYSEGVLDALNEGARC
jgi:hypothetical protein